MRLTLEVLHILQSVSRINLQSPNMPRSLRNDVFPCYLKEKWRMGCVSTNRRCMETLMAILVP